MSSFFQELWVSVFTPGTTPALVLATNVTFFFLQITLIVLYFATYSIHLIFLNIISGGLWAAINWFVKEVEEFKRGEAAKELEREEEVQRPGDDAKLKVDKNTKKEL